MYKYLVATLLIYSGAASAQALPDKEIRSSLPTSSAAASAELSERAAQLVPLLNGDRDPATMFHPDFLTQISAEQLMALATQVTASVGKASRLINVMPMSANAGTATIASTNGTIGIQLSVESASPYRVTGLRITNATANEASLPAIIAAMKALPGTTNFALYKLGGKGPSLMAGYEVDRPLSVGSAFKLVIFAELIRSISASERRWDDEVTLDGRELPFGSYRQLPTGSKVSLRNLAEKMISVSDNSATDLLLFALGRENVETMQKTLGVADPSRNRPFLGTMEAFKLKGIPRLRSRWLAADERGRRALLTDVDVAPTSELKTLFQDGKPVAPDSIEWFLSPLDLAKIMDWLRINTTGGSAVEAHGILSLNPGVDTQIARQFNYVGYKGGSEPGVIHMTSLLQTKSGQWLVLTGGWLNTEAPVENSRFAALFARATELASDIN